MNENLLDVLLYLFENFSTPGAAETPEVRADLNEAGFFPEEIDDAFAWLRDSQADEQTLVSQPDARALRLYSQAEQQILPPECRGCLIRLQHCGVLTATAREIVIDRLLALADNSEDAITVDQVKWVALMVLSNSGDDQAFAHMEALMHAEQPGVAH